MNIIIRHIENLSLAPVLVAVVNSAAFYLLQNDSINGLALLILGLICWIVYMYDGLRDIIRFPAESTSSRHLFIQKHQFNISILVIAACILSIILLFFQNKDLIFFGSTTAIFLAIYLFLVNKSLSFRIRKEYFMPIIFTMAVCGVPMAQKTSINLSTWVLAGLFFILALQNTFLSSWFENRQNPNAVNIYNKISPKTGLRFVNLCNVIFIFSFIVLFSNGKELKNGLAFIYLLISLLVSFSASKADLLQKHYRILLDILLLLPLFLILFHLGLF